jgi:glycosyltransferase involved in cell wall biosynthesis
MPLALSMNPASPPLVSVLLKSYNARELLPRAVGSAVAQVTTFDVEILLADDCSTDGSAELALDLASKHRDRIVLVPRRERLGLVRNTCDCIRRARGSYVAWLDCDDCWTDPHKLQTEVDFLESHPEFSGCCGPVIAEDDSGGRLVLGPEGTEVHLAQLLQKCWIYTPSVVFRKPVLPAWFEQLSLDDWPICAWVMRDGPFAVLPGLRAAYRLSPTSAYQTSTRGTFPTQTLRRWSVVKMWHRLAPHLPQELGQRAVMDHGHRLVATAWRERAWWSALEAWLWMLGKSPLHCLRWSCSLLLGRHP